MNRRKKIMLGIIGGVVLIMVMGVTAVIHYLSAKEKQAIQTAQAYVAQQYLQKMNYESIRFSWVDPAIYHVYFSQTNNPDLKFEVIVQQDLTLREKNTASGHEYMPDNYYMAYFELQMAYAFKNDVAKIWSNNAIAFVSAPNPALYSFAIPLGLNDQLTLSEMEVLIEEYLIYINTETPLSEENILDEAEKILAFIQNVRESGYNPDRLVMRYIVPKALKDNSKVCVFSINNWQNLITVEQVVEKMNNQ